MERVPLPCRLTNVDARTIPTALAEYVGVTGTNWGELAALGS